MASQEPRILKDGLTFPEGPRWHDGRLYFSDIHAHQVKAVDMEGRLEVIADVSTKIIRGRPRRRCRRDRSRRNVGHLVKTCPTR